MIRIIKLLIQKTLKRKIQTPLLCGIAVICILQVSFAGNSNIKQEAELFAKSALIEGNAIHAQTHATQIPGFKTDNPEEVKYYSGGSIEADSIAAKNDDENSVLIENSYNSKKEFKDDAVKMMSVSKYIEDNPQGTIEAISNEYINCEGNTEKTNNQNYEIKRCDEHISANNSCYIGNLISLDSNTNYTCTKEKELYTKTISSDLNVSCKNKQSQFFETTYQNFQGFNVSGSNLYLGVNAGTLGQNCSGHNFTWRFKIDNINNLGKLFWHSLILDDSIRVYVNGKSVWSWGYKCEHGARRSFSPNVDFTPHLKQGDNEIVFQVIVGGGGSFYSHLSWEYNKCTEFNTEWIDDVKRDVSIYETTKEETCKQSKPEECLLDGSYTTQDGYVRNDGCRSKKTQYSCTQNNYTDYCKTLSKVPACNKLESKCVVKDSTTNDCVKHEERYVCGGLEYFQSKSNTIKIENPYSVIYGSVNDIRQCSALDNTSHCDLISNITGTKSCYLGSNVSDCTQYQQNSKCTLQTTKCFNNDCTHKEKVYHCLTDKESSASLMCGNQNYCLDENCAESGEYETGTSLPRVLTYLKALEEAGKDSSKDDINNIKIFTGTGNKCEKDVLGARNCCKDSGWGKDMGLGSCSYEEENLGLQKEKGHCVYIGSYCSEEEKLTGMCIKKAQSYCCFGSMLSRIIQEQGRKQIGLNLGSAESPNCRGLTVEEMQRLDFTKIDFTEYTQELTLDMKEISKDDIEDKVIDEIDGY